MGEGVELRTESLHYDLQSNLGETDDPIRLISRQASGTARGIRYEHGPGKLELCREVDFTLKRSMKKPDGTIQVQNVRVTSQRGFYSEAELYFRFLENARLESETDVLTGDDVQATFSADKKQLTSLICRGNASYASKDTSVARELRGNRIRFGIAPATGSLEKIEVFGQAGYFSSSLDAKQELRASSIDLALDPARGIPRVVRAKQDVSFRTGRENESTTVTGENLEATFIPDTSLLDRMRVWGKAQMSSSQGSDADPDELRAEEIRMSFQDLEGRTALRELQAERSVNWKTPPRRKKPDEPPQAGRTLSADTLTILYSSGEDKPDSGHAAGRVVLTGIQAAKARSAEIRRLEADTVRFRFWQAGSRLREFEGEGRVALFYHKPGDPGAEIPSQEFRTTSTHMRATLREQDGDVETVSQWGDFVYQEGTRTATAGRGDYQAESEALVLQESPKISDANGTTTGIRIEYDRKRGILTVLQRVRSVLRRDTGAQGKQVTSPEKAASPMVVTADNMQFWNEEARARYSGSALLLSEDGQLQCKVLDIFNGGDRVEGEGNVNHILFKKRSYHQVASQKETMPGPRAGPQAGREATDLLIRSPRLSYLKGSNSIHYSENVTLESQDLWMSSESLDVVLELEGGGVEQAAARKNVVIRQTGREVKGDFADYYPSPGKIVVTGIPAQITDPQKGKSLARRLTFFTTDDRILFEIR